MNAVLFFAFFLYLRILAQDRRKLTTRSSKNFSKIIFKTRTTVLTVKPNPLTEKYSPACELFQSIEWCWEIVIKNILDSEWPHFWRLKIIVNCAAEFLTWTAWFPLCGIIIPYKLYLFLFRFWLVDFLNLAVFEEWWWNKTWLAGKVSTSLISRQASQMACS